jgi:hypothetical protein
LRLVSKKKPQDRPTALKLLKHPFILKERSVKSKKVLEDLIKEADKIIKTVGSREVALGIQSGDSDSVEKASGSSTSSSAGSPASTIDFRAVGYTNQDDSDPTNVDFSSTMKVLKKKRKNQIKKLLPLYLNLWNSCIKQIQSMKISPWKN